MPSSPRRFRIIFRAGQRRPPLHPPTERPPCFSLSFRGRKAPVGIRIPAPAGAESLPPSEREVARSAGRRDVDPPHPRCSSVGGDAHIAPSLSHHIPGGQRRPPLQPPTERPPCFFSVIPRARSARGNPHPRARRRGIPLPPSAREVARSAGRRDADPPHPRCSSVGGDAHIAPYAAAAPWHQTKGAFRAPARGTFAPGGKSTQKRRSNLRFENPCAPSPVAYLARFSHANAVPCKFHLNTALSLLL